MALGHLIRLGRRQRTDKQMRSKDSALRFDLRMCALQRLDTIDRNVRFSNSTSTSDRYAAGDNRRSIRTSQPALRRKPCCSLAA